MDIISKEEYIIEDRKITEITYIQPDGTVIIDTFNSSIASLMSKHGSDTVTRTKSIPDWGSVTITASFDWYTYGLFSYVRCSSMNASYSLRGDATVTTWNTSYTENYVSIGTAKAEVEYFFNDSIFWYQYQEGSFKITCTDSGTIKDNG